MNNEIRKKILERAIKIGFDEYALIELSHIQFGSAVQEDLDLWKAGKHPMQGELFVVSFAPKKAKSSC